MAVECLPFVWDLIEGFGSSIGLDAVILTGRLKGGPDMFDRSFDSIFDSLESVEDVEAEIVSDGFCEHLILIKLLIISIPPIYAIPLIKKAPFLQSKKFLNDERN